MAVVPLMWASSTVNIHMLLPGNHGAPPLWGAYHGLEHYFTSTNTSLPGEKFITQWYIFYAYAGDTLFVPIIGTVVHAY